MAEPLSLQLIARLVCVQSLLDLTEGEDVTNYLKAVCHSAVTEDILSHVVQFYPRKLTNEMLAGLVSPHIHNLKLVNCTQIKPSNFIKIFPHCKNLHGLDLKQCSQLMLGDFFVLIDRMGLNLTSVSVEDCTTVDDDIVHSILQNLHHLKHLNVSSCKHITDNAFLLSQDQCRKGKLLRESRDQSTHSYLCSLTSIDISGCHGLTNMAIHNLVTLTGPTLQHVCMSWTNLTLESLWCLSGLLVPKHFLGCETEGEDEDEIFSNNTTDEDTIEAKKSGSSDLKDLHRQCDTSAQFVKSASSSVVLPEQNSGTTECDNCDSNSSKSVSLKSHVDPGSFNVNDNISIVDSTKITSSNSERSVSCDGGEKLCTLEKILINLNEHPHDVITHEIDENVLAKEDESEETFKDKCTSLMDATISCSFPDIRETEEFNGKKGNAVNAVPSSFSPNSSRNLLFPALSDTLSNPKGSNDDFIENSNESEEESSTKSLDTCEKLESQAETNCFTVGGKIIPVKPDEAVLFRSKTLNVKSSSDVCESYETCQSVKRIWDTSSSGNKPLSNVPFIVHESEIPCSFEEKTDNFEVRCCKSYDSDTSENLSVIPGDDPQNVLEVSPETENEQSTRRSEFEINSESHKCHMSSTEMNVQNIGAKNLPNDFELGNFSQCLEEKNIKIDNTDLNSMCLYHSSDEYAKPNGTGADNTVTPLEGNNGILSSASFSAFVNLQGSVVECNSPTSLRNLTENDSKKLPHPSGQKIDNKSLPPMKHLYKPNIKSIDLQELHYPNNKQQALENAFSIFITNNLGLQSIKLSWIKFPNHLLRLMVDTCVEIREMTLIGCTLIDAEHMRYIGSQCANLKKVELEDIRRMTDWGVVPLLSNTEIEKLSLAESDIHDVTAIRMASKLSENLRNLNISYCSELTERGINSLLRKKSCMESLSARQGALTNLSLGLLSDNFQQLRSLNIASIEDISGSGLVCLAKNLRHLEFIDLSWAGGSCLQDEVTKAILNYCPRINRMVLSGQGLLTSKPFLPIISDYDKWSRCKALFFFKAKEREAKAVMRIEEEADSSDDEYEEVHFPHRSTNFATNLQSLCLEYCDSITDTDMEDIVTVCRGSLTVIDYYSCEVQPKLLTLSKYKIKDLSG